MATELIKNKILKNESFVFAKFGDGEYFCVSGVKGANCDGDPYNKILKSMLIEALIYFSSKENTYLGAWHNDKNVVTFFNSIVGKLPNWVDYHTCITDYPSLLNNLKLELFKAIKSCQRKKILIGNELLVKAKYLLNLNTHIVVPYKNWFESNFNQILNLVLEAIGDDEYPFIITCCGMGAKVLLHKIHLQKPNGMFLDMGSGLDYICTKKCSRGNTYSYQQLENYYKSILPANWNDPNFNYIYELAKANIGIHLKC